jgi:restriction system protein
MMSAIDAAYHVLIAAGEPLHSNEIARRILAERLWASKGKTPGATVDARIAVDIKTQGVASRFCRTGRSVFVANPNYQQSDTLGNPESGASYSPVESVAPVNPSTPTLSFADAAERVLDQFANRNPMHYQDITRKALELGLIATAGQTPAASMYAVILTEIDKRTKRGEPPRFTKHGKGLVGLAAWDTKDQGLTALIDQHNRVTRQQLHARLHTMKPAEFEVLIGRLLTTLGFEAVAVTPLAGDGGIDVRGTLVVGDVIRTRMAVQVKRWKKNVQAPVVQQVRGSLGAHEQGLIITTSDFSPGARTEAARPDATPVALMPGEQLVTLLIEHDIGVRRTTHDLIELGDQDDV